MVSFLFVLLFPLYLNSVDKDSCCCAASVASEQQQTGFKKNIKGVRILEFITFYQNALRLFTRMHCGFLPECIAPSTRMHCAATAPDHEQHEVVTPLCWRPLSRGLQLRKVSGYGLL